MQLAERLRDRWERFDARAVAWFLRAFGLALVVDVATEVAAGVWHVHTGKLYPWRHLGIVPLYPVSALAIEWALRTGAGLALVFGARQVKAVALAVRVAATVLFVALLQRYSNHGVLLFLVALYLTIAPPDVTATSFEDETHPALGLVRAQLAIVYAFSAINKLAHGFANGDSLVNLASGAGHALSSGQARALSWMVIAAEVALPFVLVRWPRAGVAAVVAMHVVFSALVPSVASFGLTMIAMAVLFSRPTHPERARPSPSPSDRGGNDGPPRPPRT